MKVLSIAALVLSVSACSLTPGMKMDGGEAQPGVEPVLKEITPQLLQEERDARSKLIDTEASALFAEPQPYRVGIGDVLSINLMGQAELPSISVMMAPIPNSQADSMVTSGFAVDQDGQVYLPYVGAVKVVGLTMRDLHNELERQFTKYIRKPDFTVQISSYRSKRVFIAGEVKSPGVVPIIDIPMTLPEALGLAGGWTNAGDPGAVEINRDGKQYVVNIPQMTAHGLNPSRILLQHGDLVRVPSLEESKVFVIGDVVKPAALLRPNSRLTLNDALSGVGGIDPSSGNPRQVYVVRRAADKKPEVYHLDAASPVALALAESFELQGKDVVYVDAAPLARWNRIVSLILPTAQLVVDSKYLNIIK
ncbi:MAG TPA: polysaccharide biosynthesis/export family protein [Gallionellaceae bacterium]